MSRVDDNDRNLVFGVLALEKGLVAGDALIEAMHTWARAGHGSLGDVLREQGAIDSTQCDLLESTLADRSGRGGDVSLETTAADEGRSEEPCTTREHLGDFGTYRGPAGDLGPGDPVDHPASAGERFRILRFHARGGLGQVSVALDRELDRQVALKEILERQADHPISRARFILEAEITGKLEHPGIVPVYGRGQHEDGRPYYAMRFIRGISLKESIHRFHSDKALRADPGRRSLRLRELLGRFLAACDAIAYAHSRGVLHRDLKPANIMLGPFGETLVVDWGLAKPLDADEVGGADDGRAPGQAGPVRISSSGHAYESTLVGSAIGSPPYMSPEQAAGDLGRLGPATDIFSLGATLYQLLSGHAPYEGRDVAEVLARALAVDYPSPRDHEPMIPKPAEAICRKAMAREPGRRYESAQALADDVRRWMADEPVSAFREPWTKRLSRWSRRHRTAVASAAALLLASAAALAISAVLIGRERDEARLQRRAARQAVDDMYTTVAEQWLEDRLDPLQREMLEKASAYYERFAKAEPADAAGRQEWGRAYLRLGDVRRKLGRREPAEAAYRRSIAILSALAADHPAVAEHREHRAAAVAGLASELASRSKGADQAEAEKRYREAEKAQTELLAGSASPARRLALARTERGLADLLRVAGRPDESEASCRRAIALLEAAVAESPAAVGPRQELAASSDALGVLLADRGRVEEAEAADRRAIDLFERLVAEAPNLPRPRDGLAKAYNSLGLLDRAVGSVAESEDLLRRQVAINDRLAGDFPDRPEYRRTLARGLTNLGILLREANRPRDAEPILRRALDLNEKLAARSPAVRNFRRDQATCLNNLGELLATTARRAESEGYYRKALKIDEDLAAEAPTVPEHRAAAAGVLNNLGVWLKASNRPQEAIAAFEGGSRAFEALAVADADRPATRRDRSKCLSNLGNALSADGRFAEAEDAFRRAAGCLDELVARPSATASDRLSLATCLSNRGSNQTAGKLPGAEESFGRSLALFEALAAGPAPAPTARRGLAAARGNLGNWQAAHGRLAEAEGNYAPAIALLDALAAESPKTPEYKGDLNEVLGHFGELRIAQGRPADARPLLERAIREGRAVLDANPRAKAQRLALRGQYAMLADLLIGQGAHADAARAGEESFKVADDPPGTRGEVARLMARCIPLAAADPGLTVARRADRAGAYADRSIVLLREAIEAGDPGADRLLEDDAFAPLRDRDGFKTLRLASAEAAGG